MKEEEERLEILRRNIDAWKDNEKILYRVNEKLIIKNTNNNIDKLLKLDIDSLLRKINKR